MRLKHPNWCLCAGSHFLVSLMETGTMLPSASLWSTWLCTWTVLGCRVRTGSIVGWGTAQLDCLWLGASWRAMKAHLRYMWSVDWNQNWNIYRGRGSTKVLLNRDAKLNSLHTVQVPETGLLALFIKSALILVMAKSLPPCDATRPAQ